ncbi:hypothetical protein HZC31_01770 [Candidatus Woesearchaeota archaeon]|nr:hypothetical protein [Candidatus Woesearchaeota archaeon]
MNPLWNKEYERKFVQLMLKKGYHCEHVAGSGKGEASVCDCVLFAHSNVYMVEVKATVDKRFYLRDSVRIQLQRLVETATKHNAIPLVAIRFKRKGWNTLDPKFVEHAEYEEGKMI